MSLISKLKKAEQEALSTVHAAQTMLNRYPDLDLSSFSLNASTSTNPFPFLVELLKSTAGYDYVIRAIAQLIAGFVPVLEVSVKTILLSHLRNLISCSFNPIIPDDILREGMVFPLDQIDPMHILDMSPLKAKKYGPRFDPDVEGGYTYEDSYQDSFGQDDRMLEEMDEYDQDGNKVTDAVGKVKSFFNKYGNTRSTGSYYYFGTEHFDTPDDLEYAGDFNAFMWYVKNRAPERSSWHGVKLLQATVGDSSWGRWNAKNSEGHRTFGGSSVAEHRSRESYCIQKKPDPSTDYYLSNCDDGGQDRTCYKDRKGAGIITLEYYDDARSVKNAEGDNMADVIPYNNAIHVMLGCTIGRDPYNKPIDYNDLKTANQNYDKAESVMKSAHNDVLMKEAKLASEKKKYAKAKAEKKTADDPDNEEKLKNAIKNAENALKVSQKGLGEAQKGVEEASKALKTERAKAEAKERTYLEITKNYYYNRTLVEFNFDYVTSLKLFDAKVMVAMLIDAITGCLGVNFGLSISYERKIMEEEVDRIVRKIVETDGVDTISDCFFTFTNRGYDEMLRKIELMQAGLLQTKNGNAAGKSPGAEYLLAGVDDISENASVEDVTDKISSIIRRAVPEESEGGSGGQNGGGNGLKVSINSDFDNIIDNLLTNLAKSIVTTLITPKVYLLFAVNLKVLDMDSDYSMADFISRHKNLLVALIQNVRDMILGFIYEQIKKLVTDLAVGEAKLLAQEQAEMYKRLLRQCMDCLARWRGRGEDFTIDNVDYADIYDEEDKADTNSDTKENYC